MKKRKIKNFILKTLAVVSGITFFATGCMLDSPSWTPTIICAVSAVYIALFVYANGKEFE